MTRLTPSLAIDDVVAGNTRLADALVALMAELFPGVLKYVPTILRRAAQPPDDDSRFRAHQWCVTVDGEPAALALFDYLPARACGLLLFLGIRPPFRDHAALGYDRLAPLLIDRALRQIEADARALGHPAPFGLVTEVEVDAIHDRYQDYGLVPLPVTYYEPIFPGAAMTWSPAMRQTDIAYQRAHLGLFPGPSAPPVTADPALVESFALAFLHDFYRLPLDNWAVRQARQSIPIQFSFEEKFA